MTIILAYLFYFSAGSAHNIYRRWLAVNKPGETGGPLDFAFKVTLVVSVLSLALPFFVPVQISGDIRTILLLSTISGVFGAGFYVASYYTQKRVDAGVSNLIAQIYTPITIVLATVFLNEKLNAIRGLGTVLLLISIVIVSKKHRLGRFRFDKYFWLLILGGASLGIFLTIFRELQKISGFSFSLIASFWAETIFLGLASWLTKNRSGHSARDTLIQGTLTFIGHLSWGILTFVVANLSLVSAVTTFKVVVLFITAAIFLKEREDLPRKILGGLIAVAGLMLMR